MKQLRFSLFTLLTFFALSFIACQNEGSESETGTDAEANTEAVSQEISGDANTKQVSMGSEEPAAPSGPTTSVTFAETSFDFGDVQDGEKVSHVYEFTNTGNEPLVISNAKGSCGCTVPKWPKNPIPPGEKGEIQVEFNSKGKTGKQTKRVTITANTDPTQTFLTITGNVMKTENPEG